MKLSIFLLCTILSSHFGESTFAPVALIENANTALDENLQQVCVGEERCIAKHAEGSAEFKIYFAATPPSKTVPEEIAPNTKSDEDKGEKKESFVSKIFGGKRSQESPTQEPPAERLATKEEVMEQVKRSNAEFEKFITDREKIKTKNTVDGNLFLAVQIADRWQILDPNGLKVEVVVGVDEVGNPTMSAVATYKRRFFSIVANGDPSQQVETLANIDKPEVEDSCLPYEVTTPNLTKIATKQTFHYMKLGLKYVTDCFKYKIEWNKNYEPAQKIFGGGIKSSCIQTGIKVINMYSYSKRPFRADGHKSGYLERSPTQFFQFLKGYTNVFSNDKDNTVQKMRRYTYVIVENMICFAVTGSDTAEDFASKHAILLRGAKSVYYAGEFWWALDKDTQKGTLYMDNNSGMYFPPQADLFRPKILMEFNIPGIVVVVLEQNTPEWKEAREKVGLI